jgi:hypothetical protein
MIIFINKLIQRLFMTISMKKETLTTDSVKDLKVGIDEICSEIRKLSTDHLTQLEKLQIELQLLQANMLYKVLEQNEQILNKLIFHFG